MSDRVKRIWILGPDRTWLPMITGADNTTTVRSVNVYDKTLKKWLNPLGWANLPLPAFTVNPRRRWHVRSPDTVWLGNEYNPNSSTDTRPGWIMLSRLQPRNDETWRIIQQRATVYLNGPYYSQAYATERDAHYPFGWAKEETTGTNRLGDQGTRTSGGGQHPFASPPLCQYQVSKIQNTVADQAITTTTYRQSTGIDMVSLRTYQQTFWPHSNYFAGQYKALSAMKLKRVVILGRAVITLSYGFTALSGSPPVVDSAYFDIGPKYTVGMETAAFGFTVANTSPTVQLYGLRRPMNVITGDTTIMTQEGVHSPTVVQPGDDKHWRKRTATRFFRLVIDNPGENIIQFGVNAADIPETGAVTVNGYPYPQTYDANFQMFADAIEYHYAMPGKDIPAELIPTQYGVYDDVVIE